MKRTIFYLNNDCGKEIKAGGIIFYKYINDEIYLLLIKSNNKYEDFGGKTDNSDQSICETIAREVEEESNKIFKKKNILKRIEKCTDYIYSSISKYLIYVIELSEEESNIDVNDFGEKEYHDNILRTVEYISLKEFMDKDFQSKLNFRIRNYSLFNKLMSLVNK